MPVGLREVAERAGVSIKTVSNVVHDYPHVRPETRARVRAAIDELHYRPNLSARSLRRGRSGVVALAVPTLQMPYFAELAAAFVAAAERRGLTVLVSQTDGVIDRERMLATGLPGGHIDGLVLSPMHLTATDLRHRAPGTPVVLLGERITRGPVDHVAIDNVKAARTATAHLVGLGRRRVAAIGCQRRADSASGVATLRRKGYDLALQDAGLALDEDLAPPVPDYTRADGARAMAQLLDLPDPPDAVFCFSDLLALGALRTLARRGVPVPEAVAVVGFDDIEDAGWSTPTLTTVAPDKAELAERALAMLEERITGQPGPARDVRIGFELVVRESTVGTSPSDPDPGLVTALPG